MQVALQRRLSLVCGRASASGARSKTEYWPLRRGDIKPGGNRGAYEFKLFPARCLADRNRDLTDGVLFADSGAGVAQSPDQVDCPFEQGGTYDLTARLLSLHIAPVLGQPVLVENRAGAGGNIATSLSRSSLLMDTRF